MQSKNYFILTLFPKKVKIDLTNEFFEKQIDKKITSLNSQIHFHLNEGFYKLNRHIYLSIRLVSFLVHIMYEHHSLDNLIA